MVEVGAVIAFLVPCFKRRSVVVLLNLPFSATDSHVFVRVTCSEARSLVDVDLHLIINAGSLGRCTDAWVKNEECCQYQRLGGALGAQLGCTHLGVEHGSRTFAP